MNDTPQAVRSSAAVIWLRRLRVMTWKELLQLGRDKVLLFLVLYAFTADVFNAGSGVTLQLSRAATAILDMDHSYASRELISRFQPPQFALMGETGNARTGLKMLDRGEAMAVIDVPPNFQRDLMRGRPVTIQIQVDATNSVLGFLASSYAAQIVAEYSLETGMDRAGLSSGGQLEAPVVKNDYRVWFNPNQRDDWFMSISELLNVITVFAILLPAAALVREKERGTIEQLLVSPLSAFQVLVPKVISMTAVILVATAISVFGVLQPVFAVPLRGSLVLFFAVTMLYVFCIAGLGLFIGTITRNLSQASMLAILILAPMMFLSGVWTPPEAMPTVVRYGMYLSPLHYFVDASYAILLKGAGLDIIGHSLVGIILLGGLLFGLGVWRFRSQFA